MIISGPADEAPQWYVEFARIVKGLTRDGTTRSTRRSARSRSTRSSIDHVEDQIGIDNLYDTVAHHWCPLNNAVKAKGSTSAIATTSS